MSQPTAPLDVQIARDRAKRPTPGQAARVGALAGLGISGLSIALELVGRAVPGILAPQSHVMRTSMPFGIAVTVTTHVLAAVLVAEMFAAWMRWQRRAATRFWYRDRAV